MSRSVGRLLRRPLLYLTQVRTEYKTVNNEAASKEPSFVAKNIQTRIKATGPLTVADYMKEVLTSPTAGYYMHRDVFGIDGDFVTSPELSQIFGEMIAIWFLNEWSKAGSPKPLQIVELGPGRGTLGQDMLRVFEHFQALNNCSLHLVEISPVLSELQARRLCLQYDKVHEDGAAVYKRGISHQGIPVQWYRHLEDVPRGFTIFVAHEFFDALPVHKFQKTEGQPQTYREVLVDIDEKQDCGFRYVMARNETPASKMYIKSDENRSHLEVSPQSLVLCKQISERITSDGGLALIADYGHDGSKTDTFRAFKKHQLHDPLVEPGSADLTADVDFHRLKEAATESGDVIAYGPVTQKNFLLRMAIEHRYKALKAKADAKQLEALKYGYHMIMDDDKMGERFKFLGLLPATLKPILDKHPPVGFC